MSLLHNTVLVFVRITRWANCRRWKILLTCNTLSNNPGYYEDKTGMYICAVVHRNI